VLEFQQAGDNLQKKINHNHKMSLQNYVQHPLTLLYKTYNYVNPNQGSPFHSISQMLGQYF
jgi:hypothetical protein